MIIRVSDRDKAKACDKLLTKLINSEGNTLKNFVVKNYFENVIGKKNHILLAYEEKNIIVGYIYLKPTKDDSNKGYLIDGLFVEEKFRNKGIAKKLVNESLSLIKEYDISFVDVNVIPNNDYALKIYQYFGFKEFKIQMKKNFN